MITPTPPPSFDQDIKPLFSASDRTSMAWRFDLWNYHEVRDAAQEIAAVLAAGSMPCDSAWPEAQVTLFEHWVSSGMAP